jgi:hypothetical protein
MSPRKSLILKALRILFIKCLLSYFLLFLIMINLIA